MSDTISRRTLAKGAAWSVPAVTLAGAAPTFAASGPDFTVVCPTGTNGPVEYYYGDNNIGTMGVSAYNTGTAGSTSSYGLNFSGGWKVPAAIQASDGTNITGFILTYGYCGGPCITHTWPSPWGTVTGTNHAGTAFSGRLTQSAPALCEPRLASGGGATTAIVQTDLQHRAGYCTDQRARLATLSIPVTVLYLDGIRADSRRSQPCCSYLNLTFNNTGCADGTFGYDITGMSWSQTPLY